MRDAIHLALDYMKGQCATCTAKGAKRDKKVILVITDGNDNTSNETLEQLVRKARQSEVLIYCIGLLNDEEPREARAAKRALNELAAASGGLAYYPKSLSEVESITPQIAHEIRNQYILAYTPLNAALDGSFRAIKVTVKAPGNPTVRTRNGYFANPAPPAKPAKPSGPGDK
jgi:VWFA-related protein